MRQGFQWLNRTDQPPSYRTRSRKNRFPWHLALVACRMSVDFMTPTQSHSNAWRWPRTVVCTVGASACCLNLPTQTQTNSTALNLFTWNKRPSTGVHFVLCARVCVCVLVSGLRLNLSRSIFRDCIPPIRAVHGGLFKPETVIGELLPKNYGVPVGLPRAGRTGGPGYSRASISEAIISQLFGSPFHAYTTTKSCLSAQAFLNPFHRAPRGDGGKEAVHFSRSIGVSLIAFSVFGYIGVECVFCCDSR